MPIPIITEVNIKLGKFLNRSCGMPFERYYNQSRKENRSMFSILPFYLFMTNVIDGQEILKVNGFIKNVHEKGADWKRYFVRLDQ